VHRHPGRQELVIGPVLMVATAALWLGVVADTARRAMGAQSAYVAVAATATILVITLLMVSSGVYLLARQGALLRFRDHRAASRAALDEHFTEHVPSVTVLVPSYAEEVAVVRATLWSAVLQEFPRVRVVLLLDDLPFPADPTVAARLDATRALAGEITAALAVPSTRHRHALAAFDRRRGPVTARDVLDLAAEFEAGAAWLEDQMSRQVVADHADRFFVETVLGAQARELRATAVTLRTRPRAPLPTRRTLRQLHFRLSRLFAAEVATFERKRYASLSHESNKAMNLNAYISLMGGSWAVRPTDGGAVLVPAVTTAEAVVVAPDTDYVLTLDADSVLLPGYCLRLVHELERPGNERVAVAQTPYTSFPGAPTPIERVAGATTDLQHLQHQGKTRFDATFWVGANAIIRRAALADLEQVREENGILVRTYIQDRTVIEDTESSIDLAIRGWSLTNYPERLSYSATPSDFGSLVVQRRRWANGGLIILPKLHTLLRQRRRRGERTSLAELALRTDYLGSIAWSSLGVVLLQVLMLVPGTATVVSPIALAATLPYLVGQALDLRRLGYPARLVVWVGGLNLALVVVNLAGALKSLQQGLTGQKIPFARTPKV
jgi:cellulose synthase/poly-beta-1,6-N-acetylglucosamine synthase-like glycosyltransferase